ncbi:MAG TPA: amino acid adenylation domain-containing protein, partial [Mycobacteriales bacterium]|nr:amino acid adenylation domain-containing protein [Mycobacteriales bacterium]
LDHLERLLAAVVADPSTRIGTVDLLGATETRRLLAAGTGPARPVPATSVVSLVAAQAARTPDRVAVVDASTTMTYAQLMAATGRVADLLRARGVSRGARVAVCLDRCADLVPALLGVLAAGAAYLPVDPWYPVERMRFMLADSRAAVVLTHTHLVAAINGGATGGVETICLDAPSAQSARPAESADGGGTGGVEAVAGTDPAYVIYTSGSTGTPKGVVLRHRGLVNVLTDLTRAPGIDADDVVAAVTTPSFDIAAVELFAPLLVGARVAVVPREETADGAKLGARLAAFGVTVGQGTPTTWRLLVDAGWRPPAGFRVLCGGEAFPPELADRLLDLGAKVWNGYGPTETTIYSAMHRVTAVDGPVPLGGPVSNTTLRVLDPAGRLAPVGVPGELHIGGVGLAEGYLHHPELTAERFGPDPTDPTGILYRTGDFARWRADGLLEYLGRGDQQVKLRGYRIELGEIESVLSGHPGVGQAAVALRGGPGDDRRLVAYLTATADPPAPAELRDRLARHLPSYMIPADYVVLDRLPHTPSGKLDRAGLPEPDPTGHPVGAYVPPRRGVEELVAGVYAQVLGVARVGADDDFFLLGGNSLQAATALARIAEDTAVTLPMRVFYTHPSVRAVAEAVRRSGTAGSHLDRTGPDQSVDPLVDLRSAGTRRPLFCVHNASGSAYTYLALAARLPADQPLLAFEAPGLESDIRPHDRVAGMAGHYLAALRRRQPDGPYRLLGYSMGGLVAFELANLLVASGQRVELLALVDTVVPEPGDPPTTEQALRWFTEDLAGLSGRRPPPLDPELAGLPETVRLPALLDSLRAAGLVPAEVGVDFLRRRIAVFTANATAMWTYRPARQYPGTLTLVRAAGSADTRAGWSALCDRLDDHVVPGDHFTLWAEPGLTQLAGTLRDRLRAAEATGGDT